MIRTQLFLLAVILTSVSCSSPKADSETTARETNRLKKNKTAAQPEAPKTTDIFNNPFRNINNFDFETGNKFIDSIYKDYLVSGKAMTNKEVCLGDWCECYQKVTTDDGHTVLYIFKGDGGEYGFSNDQFLLKNDSLYFVRNFSVSIKEWPNDNRKTVWEIAETTYKFESLKVRGTQKIAQTEDLGTFDLTMRNVPAKEIVLTWKETYNNVDNELNRHFEFEKEARQLTE